MPVSREEAGPALKSYLQSPTRACGGSNPAVRSPWDNDPTPARAAAKPRGETVTASIEAVRGQGLDGMASISEPVINAVTLSKSKMLIGLDQKVRDPARG